MECGRKKSSFSWRTKSAKFSGGKLIKPFATQPSLGEQHLIYSSFKFIFYLNLFWWSGLRLGPWDAPAIRACGRIIYSGRHLALLTTTAVSGHKRRPKGTIHAHTQPDNRRPRIEINYCFFSLFHLIRNSAYRLIGQCVCLQIEISQMKLSLPPLRKIPNEFQWNPMESNGIPHWQWVH